MSPRYSVTSRSQERTIAMLRRKLANTEACLNKTKHKIVEIIHFVVDTDINDQEDVRLSWDFVICKSNEILNATPAALCAWTGNDSQDETEDDSEGESEYDSEDDSDDEMPALEGDSDVEMGGLEDDSDDEMPALEGDSDVEMGGLEDDSEDEMPALEGDSDDDMPALEDEETTNSNQFVNELEDSSQSFTGGAVSLNPLNYDFTYLNHQTHKFENITIDGLHYYHDKYGDVTGYMNLLLVFDSNQDLEAVSIYNPNLDIENTLPIQD